MGLLKHVVLPLMSLLHAFSVYSILIQGPQNFLDAFAELGFDRQVGDSTELELQLAAAIGGAHLAMLLNDLAAIFWESAHFRAMAALVDFIYLAVDAWHANKLGKEAAKNIMVLAALPLIGLIVHAMEPGIFTKDKKTKAKNN